MAPYVEGVVGPDNQIVINDLVSGEYRLTISANGYVPLDAVLNVTDGDDPQQIVIQMQAVQTPSTPTPSPSTTPELTAEATAQTTPPGVVATEEPPVKSVTGLPETGSGDRHISATWLVLAGAAMALIICVGIRRNAQQ